MLMSKGLKALARVPSLAFAVTLFTGVLVNWMMTSPDPHRCNALLHKGNWLDPPNVEGHRDPYSTWQPDGCMLRQYSNEDIHRCMGDKHMVFSGDSTDRQIFWAMARLLDRNQSLEARERAGIHESYDMVFDGIRLKQIWNPYLETGPANFDLTQELERFAYEKHYGPPANASESLSASIIVLGAGSWYVLERFHDEGIAGFNQALLNASSILQLQNLTSFGTLPMDPVEGIGDEVFVTPVLPPDLELLPDYRKTPEGIQAGEVEDLDQMLADIAPVLRLRMLWSFLDLSRDQPHTIVDPTITGFHVIDSIAEMKATILLNLRCNAKLDALDGYPYARTCCTDYGASTWPSTQVFILALTTMYALACIGFDVWDIVSGAETPRHALLNMDVGIFAVALLFCSYADRTQLFAKGSKVYYWDDFELLAVLSAVVGVITIRTSRARAPRRPAAAVEESTAPAVPAVEDCGVLSRDQTDEWKGWMQAVILIYHWTGASRHMPIYMFIRVVVGAYLFQSGYGHAVYFLSKKDFSFRRVAAVLLRLNLLSCALPYIMNTDYMLYYFAPLVSFWFLVVYATFAIGSGYNHNTPVLLGKIAASLCIVVWVMNWTPLTSWVFSILSAVFGINWDLHEWEFRAGLDVLSVYVGMVCGVVYLRVKRDEIIWTNLRMGVVPALMIFQNYYLFCLHKFAYKTSYNTLAHPYYSFLPILAYVGLRNAFAPLRNYYSTAFAWLGRCSLETFILQFHIYLAADTQGVLLLDIFRGGDGTFANDRWRDLVVIVPVFLWLSSRVADATAALVKMLTASPQEQDYDDVESGAGYKLLESYKLDRAAKALILLRGLTPRLADVRVRVGALLLLMWFVNLIY